ncbi:phosphodiesterase [Roseospira goensis]|uniref:3',5'-cyclic AMP phosphodiesterase CpdA n=1 Tax=Roseospira goensis TaxID=391922 RepID=A0A7W6RXE0_9PROT|nr:phosphodiesterase [Roseospira goensis]MBB4284349.1 3',5'-cyclic AMP phosphodiesterase CpdA [Roseospira goensis]
MKIIHLSDPHIVAAPRALYGTDPRRRLALAVAHINRHHADAAFVWLTGDLTHDGDDDDYQALKDILAGCRVTVHPGLGNHDARAPFHRVFPEAPMGDPDYLQYAVDTPEGVFLMLDTLEPGLSSGRLDATRLAWLEARLGEHADRDVYIGLHHPPRGCGLRAMDRQRLTQGDHLLGELLAGHGRVRHLFHGHVHRPLWGTWRGIPLSSVPSPNHQVALRLSSDPTVLGCFDSPGYAVVEIADGETMIHLERVPLDEDRVYDMGDKAAESAATPDAIPTVTRAAADAGL